MNIPPIEGLSYPIQLESAGFLALNNYLKAQAYDQLFILVDTNTQRDCLPILSAALSDFHYQTITIEAGEQHKNLTTCEFIWQQFLATGASRRSVLLNLGGGVIGDMGGFCASTFKRGMDFVQIPTTLLAQVDASIGGKLGIDFGLLKNGLGLFANPKAVFLYPDFFQTLPSEELLSGYAEVIKHALIKDSNYWKLLQTQSPNQIQDWAPIIQQSLHIKQAVVLEDPFEKGLRKILNFGHTIGHAVESLSWDTNRPLLHGEAVAIGMLAESYISTLQGHLSAQELELISDYISNLYSYYPIEQLDQQALQQLILQDKKNTGKKTAFSLLEAIGTATFNQEVSEAQIQQALAYYKTCYQ